MSTKAHAPRPSPVTSVSNLVQPWHFAAPHMQHHAPSTIPLEPAPYGCGPPVNADSTRGWRDQAPRRTCSRGHGMQSPAPHVTMPGGNALLETHLDVRQAQAARTFVRGL